MINISDITFTRSVICSNRLSILCWMSLSENCSYFLGSYMGLKVWIPLNLEYCYLKTKEASIRASGPGFIHADEGNQYNTLFAEQPKAQIYEIQHLKSFQR